MPSTGDDLVLGGEPAHIPTINDLAPNTVFRSLSLGTFAVKGNALTVGAGGFDAEWHVSTQVPVMLSASQTWTVAPYGDVYFSEAVDLGPNDVEFVLGPFSGISFSGPVSGMGEMTLRGGGTLYFTGAENGLTSATGTLSVFDATLILGNSYPGQILMHDPVSRLFFENGTSSGPIAASGGTIYTPFEFQPVHVRGLALAPGVTYRQGLTDAVTYGYGKVMVRGGVTLGGAVLVVASQLSFQSGTEFLIIDNDGTDAVSGTFSQLPEGARFRTAPLGPAWAEQTFAISYIGGDGNDVVLVADPASASIPSTSQITLVLLIAILGTLAWIRVGRI